MKLMYIFILSVFYIVNSYSQELISVEQAKAKKLQGLIKEITHSRIYYTYYYQGIKDGAFVQIDADGNIGIIGEYKNNEMCGTWYYFNRKDGMLMFKLDQFARNKNLVVNNNDYKNFLPEFRCYFRGYHSNGKVENEGILLWCDGDSPESDMSIEYGEWKYYDSDGKLIKTKVFK